MTVDERQVVCGGCAIGGRTVGESFDAAAADRTLQKSAMRGIRESLGQPVGSPLPMEFFHVPKMAVNATQI